MFVFIHRCAVLHLDGWFARNGVGVLACILMNRFHATSQYQWLWNDYEIEDETYAILYTSTCSCGEYKCRWWMKIFMNGVYVFSVTNNIRSCWYSVFVALYITETITDANKLDSNCIWQKGIIGEKTTCQLQLWKDTLCWQQCCLTVYAWTLSMIFTLWILCSPVEQVITQLGFELANQIQCVWVRVTINLLETCKVSYTAITLLTDQSCPKYLTELMELCTNLA